MYNRDETGLSTDVDATHYSPFEFSLFHFFFVFAFDGSLIVNSGLYIVFYSEHVYAYILFPFSISQVVQNGGRFNKC